MRYFYPNDEFPVITQELVMREFVGKRIIIDCGDSRYGPLEGAEIEDVVSHAFSERLKLRDSGIFINYDSIVHLELSI